MSAEPRAFAFISLLRDDAEARGLAGLLEGLARLDATAKARFLIPEVRGLDFFAAGDSQASLDHWWGANIPADALPIYLLSHERGLAAWMLGLDGVFFVAVGDEDASGYSQWIAVRSEIDGAPLSLAQAVITRYGALPKPTTAGAVDLFDIRDARMIARLRADSSGEVAPAPAAPSPPPVSVELPAAESERVERESPAWSSSRSQQRAGPAAQLRRSGLLRAAMWGPRNKVSDAELAALLLLGAPRIVVVGSRKDGVGKTSHAAGLAISGGTVLDSVGHSAAIVDANVANPDAWGQLHLPEDAATVRDVVAALARGVQPAAPIHAVTPGLAWYPERRDGSEYTHTDIHRLAVHLRARYSLVIVDMSNRHPDPISGPEAAVAAFWLEEADALVLPTAMSRQDFNGVLDYLDVRGRLPTIVPCITSGARRNRRHPVNREYLKVIASRVDRVLEIPDEVDSVRLAGMDGVPVEAVSAKMRVAYRALAEAVARLPVRTRA